MKWKIIIFVLIGILIIAGIGIFSYKPLIKNSFSISNPTLSTLEHGGVSDNLKSPLIKGENISKYGMISITNSTGSKIASLELKDNTDYCGLDCSAETEIIMYKDGVLIDNIKFVGGDVSSYSFSIREEKETLNLTKYYEYKEYKIGEKVSAGKYYIRLDGTRSKPLKTTDWQVTSQNILIDDWALWNVSSAVYDGRYLDTSAKETTPTGVFLSPDGTKLYTIGYGATAKVHQYNLSTPWNLNTSIWNSSKDISAGDIYPCAIFFNGTGTEMYFSGQNGKSIFQYHLTSPWDIQSATYLQKISVASTTTSYDPYALYISPDGSKMYVGTFNSQKVFAYNLTKQWNVSSAVGNGTSYNPPQVTTIGGIYFNDSGNKLYILGNGNGIMSAYNLTSPFWINSSSYAENLSSLIGGTTGVMGTYFKSDGTQFFYSVYGQAKIYSYTMTDTSASDTIYPSFSSYYDDNASLLDTGTGHFNVTVKNTNGTVYLWINNTRIYATNLSANNYNVSYTFTHGGNYLYNWTAYGNGTLHNINISNNFWYTVNSSVVDTCSYSSGNWNVNCADYCNITSNINGGGTGNNFSATGTGWFKMTANLSGFKNYKFGGGCNATCTSTGCIRI